ncbi:sulfite exporter TauE/SafE family protein [Hyphococcus luteus]|nr:sulfite exporter TauE/SafE family protein [Marinicaulis flavus]
MIDAFGSFSQVMILFAAAFGAGVLNTIAGGGTFLTFPALVLAGITPVAANATSAVAVFPGYLGGAFGFRKELFSFDRRFLLRLICITTVGGIVGSGMLVVSSDRVFSFVIPFLLLVSTLIFLFGERLRIRSASSIHPTNWNGVAGMFAVSVYGEYFNGGLGIVMLALFALWGMSNLHRMNALKSGLSFVLSALSVGVFAIAGLIAWPQAAIMMFASTLGGYAGAPIARALPRTVLRALIAAIGFGTSAIFFARLGRV